MEMEKDMDASIAFDRRKGELLAQLEQADTPEQAAQAAVMTLELVACDLAQDEQDDLLRQRQQAVLALARSAPAFLRAARARGELVVAAQEKMEEKKRFGLAEAGALLLGALAVFELIDGNLIFAVLQAAGAGMMYLAGMKPAQKQTEYRAQGVLGVDAQELVRALEQQCRAADICVSDLRLVEQENVTARLSGTADEAMLDLLVALLEARATGRGEVALRSLDQAEIYLRMLGVEAASFSRETAHMFDVLPTLSGERTIRPALLRDGKLIRRGVAACAAAQGAAR
ncbi:MAG: hypothetical protein J6K32_00600 [Clostridia bacterium]|nr:hypothetical protein [Clostridia bacterium]